MQPAGSRFTDIALPVPLDKPFTYELPETLRHRVQPGCRLLVPFANRKLTGVALACHDTSPPHKARQALRLLDEEPALTEELLGLGRWIADYYCAPIGEVLKTMLPLGGETRTAKVVSLTPGGMEAARQFTRSSSPDDPYVQVLRTLEKRPRSADYLKRKLPASDAAIRGLKRKGWLEIESVVKQRDPLRARGGRLVVAAEDLDAAPKKPTKGERWLIAYLTDHPGAHDVEALELERKDVATVARRLAKTGVVRLSKIATGDEAPDSSTAQPPPRLQLNSAQLGAFEAVRQSIRSDGFQTFLLHGITGSGKTEVYLRAIEQTLAKGKSALLLVPEIALTPAVASQFFARFGDDMAILHSAFSGLERSGQWRRVREGKARVVLGTRSGVFAPVENLGLVVVDEEHDASYKQDETPPLQRP